MRPSRSVVALVAATVAVPAILLAVHAQTASTKAVLQTWSRERLQEWVVEEFQSEPDVAALIREVVATYGDLYDAWKAAKGEDDPAVKAVEDRQGRLMAKYFALWDARREEIRRRAPAEATASEDPNPLVLDARIQGLFKADVPVPGLIRAILAADRAIGQHEAAGVDREAPAFKAALELRSELTAQYNALWDARSGEIRRRLLMNDRENAPADLESRISSERGWDREMQLLNQKISQADREVLDARNAGRGRDDPDLKAAEKRQAELWAKSNAAWFARYDEFRRRVLAGTDAFASRQVSIAVGDIFRRAPDVVALEAEMSKTDEEIARLSTTIPNLRDDAARKPWEQRKAALSARHNALWQERYPALYKQAVAELQSKFTPKPEAPAVVAKEDGQAPGAGRPPAKAVFMPGGPEPYYFTPIPKTIAAHVSGVALDERDRPIARAEVTLYAVTNGARSDLSVYVATDEDPKATPAATTTTDAEGRYEFRGVQLPVLASFRSGADRNPPPMIRFLVSGEAPGEGIAWGSWLSMWQYHLQNMEANGGEGHPFLRTDVTIDLKLRKAAVLQGKVVDDNGEPIPGATIRVVDFAEFGPDGRETNDVQGFETRNFPDGVGHCRTETDGGFRIEGLTEGACYSLVVTRPDSPRTEIKFHATTLEGPDQIHQPFFSTHGGRGKHEARTNPITITLPGFRPIEVHVAAEGDRQPVAGARLKLVGDSSPLTYIATGDSDAEGELRLDVPPGRLSFLASKPPEGSRFLESYLHSLKVEPGDAPFAIEVPQEVGAELIIEAVEAGTGRPMADVFFGLTEEAPLVDQPRTSHDVSSVLPRAWTNEKGVLHVAVAPHPGRRYRFHFAAMREPVTTLFNPSRSQTYGYEASPARSEPVGLVAGKPVRLRFELRKGPPDPNPQRQLQGAPKPARKRAGPPKVSSR